MLELCKQLDTQPVLPHSADIAIRTYAGEADLARWLDVRNAAFTELSPGGRPWTAAQFKREFLSRCWWRPDWLWFAEDQAALAGRCVGVVGLALRDNGQRQQAAVHWLAVRPEAAGRGIASALLSQLERAAWEAGFRELRAQTHVNWKAAMAFYASRGFVRISPAEEAPQGGLA